MTIMIDSTPVRLYEDETGAMEIQGWDSETEKWDFPVSQHCLNKIVLTFSKFIDVQKGLK